MKMRCALCGRGLSVAAVLIGELAIGPRCSRKAGLLGPARKRQGLLTLAKGRAKRSEDGQMDLELEAMA